MTQHAIDTFEAAGRAGRHDITSQTNSKRLTKTNHPKTADSFSPTEIFFRVGKRGLVLNQAKFRGPDRASASSGNSAAVEQAGTR